MNKSLSEKCLKLFSNCILVKGIARACIYDLQRKNIYPVPLTLADIFDENGLCNRNEIWFNLDEKSRIVFLEYCEFLFAKELVFECDKDEVMLFPKLNEEFLYPSRISNAILDSDNTLEYFTVDFLKHLEVLSCNHIQFRFFNIVSNVELERILDILEPSQVKSFEIVLPENKTDKLFFNFISRLISENNKISSIIVSGADKTEILKYGANGMGYILKVTECINSHHHCGIIDVSNFSVNIPTYTESLKFNSCLNRKISIDKNGSIKNCPSMKTSYGNISTTSLLEAVNHPDFQKIWSINKDKITKCNACEFRYVCTDCRAYLEDPNDTFSAPLKCGYDPVTCSWEDWTTNPLKAKAINFYEIQ